MAELHEMSIRAIADKVRAGGLRATEVLDKTLARLEKINPSINAFVFVDADSARRVATKVDQGVRAGRDPGPLAGVTFGVKCVEDVKGWPHTWASTALAESKADTTSTQVRRLLDAGAVPVGLTASPEFAASSYCSSELYGVSRNPWDTDLTPGGSSGGSAAAVAAGIVPMATGSDSGGSLRIPAAYCGVVGFKGTYGRVPRGPSWVGSANVRNYGVLTRNVLDQLRVLDVISGADEHDPLSLPGPAETYERAVPAIDLTGKKVVFSSDLGFGLCDPDLAAITERAADDLIREAGLERVDVEVNLPDTSRAWIALAAPDQLVTRSRMGGKAADLGANATAMFEMASEITVEDIARANLLRDRLDQTLADIFDQVDFILTPTTSVPAFAADGPMPSEIAGEPTHALRTVAQTYPFNLSGHPAVSVPADRIDDVPVGLQIVGRRHADDLVLAAALVSQRARPWPMVLPT